MIVPSSLSRSIKSNAPTARIIETADPTVAANTCATRRPRPSGMNDAVASAINFPSRAASDAPRKPTQSVRCWTKEIEPGIPPLRSGRTTISANGNRTIAAKAKLANHCSPSRNTRATRLSDPAAASLSLMSNWQGKLTTASPRRPETIPLSDSLVVDFSWNHVSPPRRSQFVRDLAKRRLCSIIKSNHREPTLPHLLN